LLYFKAVFSQTQEDEPWLVLDRLTLALVVAAITAVVVVSTMATVISVFNNSSPFAFEEADAQKKVKNNKCIKDKQCPGAPNATPICKLDGVCGITCNEFYKDCDGITTNGCEVFVGGSDVTNCGFCGNDCRDTGGPNAVCNQGTCECGPGLTLCGASGCVDTKTNVAHCGQGEEACGNDCRTVGGPNAVCNQGTCECGPGLTLCGASGCVDTDSDENNCGICGNPDTGEGICSDAGGICESGHCTCPPGTEMCGGQCQAECPSGQVRDPNTCACKIGLCGSCGSGPSECGPGMVCGVYDANTGAKKCHTAHDLCPDGTCDCYGKSTFGQPCYGKTAGTTSGSFVCIQNANAGLATTTGCSPECPQ
jgi:hypothetical protein